MRLYFPTLPDLVRTSDKAVLKSDYHFSIDGVDYFIPKGFVWDGASIPWVLRWKYGTPFDKVHLVGGLVHDAIYGNSVIEVVKRDKDGNIEYSDLADFTRYHADNIYYALIRENGAVMLRAFKEWAAIRFFGYTHWYNYKKGTLMKKIIKILGAIIGALLAAVALAGCKSIKFEKIERTPIMDGTNLVCVCENEIRGSYFTYGLKSNLEGLEFSYSPTNGVTLAINKADSDMSDKHEKIIDASGSAAGKVAGVAASAALGTSAAGSAAEAVKDMIKE